jgi:molybdenum ABC transporter molybdate-binding protein
MSPLVLRTLNPDLKLTNWQGALHSKAITRVALADPQRSPDGREAMRVLASQQLGRRLAHKLVFAESISCVNQYVMWRIVEVGITGKPVALSPELSEQSSWVELPRSGYTPIPQSVMLLRNGARRSGAARFCVFCRGRVHARFCCDTDFWSRIRHGRPYVRARRIGPNVPKRPRQGETRPHRPFCNRRLRVRPSRRD